MNKCDKCGETKSAIFPITNGDKPTGKYWCEKCCDEDMANAKKPGLVLFDKYRNKALDEVLAIPNPYPEDIWIPVPKEVWPEIHKMLQEKFNMPLDRVSGDLMRRSWNNYKEAINNLKENKK